MHDPLAVRVVERRCHLSAAERQSVAFAGVVEMLGMRSSSLSSSIMRSRCLAT